jgi:hypothetical protein
MSQGTKYNSFKDNSTLSGTLTLSAASDKFQTADPDGSARTVQLPDLRDHTNDTTSGTGQVGTDLYADHSSGFFVINNAANGDEALNIKGWNGTNTTTTLGTPTQAESAICYWTGSTKGWIVNVVSNA